MHTTFLCSKGETELCIKEITNWISLQFFFFCFGILFTANVEFVVQCKARRMKWDFKETRSVLNAHSLRSNLNFSYSRRVFWRLPARNPDFFFLRYFVFVESGASFQRRTLHVRCSSAVVAAVYAFSWKCKQVVCAKGNKGTSICVSLWSTVKVQERFLQHWAMSMRERNLSKKKMALSSAAPSGTSNEYCAARISFGAKSFPLERLPQRTIRFLLPNGGNNSSKVRSERRTRS